MRAAAALLACARRPCWPLLLAGCATTTPPRRHAPATAARATASRPPTSPTRRKRARAAHGAGRRLLRAAARSTTALDQIKLAIAADPTYADAFNLRGLIYCSLGDDRPGRRELPARAAAQPARRRRDAQLRLAPVPAEALSARRSAHVRAGARRAAVRATAPRTLLTQGVCQARAGQLRRGRAQR